MMELDDHDKQRIRAEEIFRREIQEELSKNAKTRPTLWQFLNSSFGNITCSAVLIPLFIFMFTSVQGCHESKQSQKKSIEKLDIEIGYRFGQAWKHLETSRALTERRDFFLKESDAIRTPTHVEFRGRATIGLLIELSRQLDGDKKKEVEEAILVLNARNENPDFDSLKIRRWLPDGMKGTP